MFLFSLYKVNVLKIDIRYFYAIAIYERNVSIMKVKMNAVSFTRVVSMIFIVLCHIIPYYDFIPGSTSLSGIFNVGIDSFLIISGYLYGDKKIEKFSKWYLDRFMKICLPSSIFVIIISIIFLVLGENINILSTLVYTFNLSGIGACIRGFNFYFIKIDAFEHLWFIFYYFPSIII